MPALRRLPFRERPALYALLLGIAAATGFEPLALWPLTLVGLAGLLLLVARAPSLGQALWRGWLFGVGHFTVNDNWFQHAFDFQDKMPPVLGYAAAVGLALYLAVFPMAAAGVAWLARRGRQPDLAFVLAFAAAWIATEWLRSVLLTGYAWDPIAVVWLPLIGVARTAALVGTYALSGLTVLVAGTLVLTWRAVGIAAAAVVVAALAAPLGRAPDAAPGTPHVRVVQPNINQNDRGDDDADRVLAALLRGSGRPGPVPRLVVWPEGMVRDYIADGYPRYVYQGRAPGLVRAVLTDPLGPRDLLLAGGTALIFGRDDDVTAATNSVYALAPGGGILGRYDKAHLVPYGEYLPVPWLLGPLGLARLVPGDIDFLAGPGPATLDLPGFGPVGVQICYEIVFSGRVVDEAHRPRLLFNPSNDAWFGRWGPPQHLAQARMRAIEEGLPIVRATPTGVSAIIAADGRLLASVPLGTAGAIERPIPPALPPTPFARLGNALAGLVALLLAATAIAIRRRAR